MDRLVTAFLVSLLAAAPAQAADAPKREPHPKVLVSIKPLHSIVANVMGRSGKPELLIPGSASPHTYALKPSDARKVSRADVIFWVGPALESFLERPLSTLAKSARIIALADAQGVLRLPARHGGLWGGDEHGHENAPLDGHVWLDPRNAAAMARAAAVALTAADPRRGRLYAANAAHFEERMKRLDGELAAKLAPVRSRPYIVFHDAFHYFELRYGLSPSGAVTVAADRPVGAGRIESLRRKIGQTNAICVFSTPQYPPKLLHTLTEGASARTGVLDDIGADIPAGPAHYETLMRRIADALFRCLAPRAEGKIR
ncbi:MAG: zinc ABC transporter substrate-binding protein [Alphaproteobacteria bacterium]